MKRIVVKLSGMPFDPTYEIDDDTIAIGDLVRVADARKRYIFHPRWRNRTVIAAGQFIRRSLQTCCQSLTAEQTLSHSPARRPPTVRAEEKDQLLGRLLARRVTRCRARLAVHRR
jgi:hypothetical protein